MEYTRQYLQTPRKVKYCISISFGKGKIPKSNWLWFLKRKTVELIHGNIWLDKILSKNAVIVSALKGRMRCFKPGYWLLDSWVFEYGHAPYLILVVWGMSKKLKQIKIVLQILYTDFPPFMQLFSLKKVQHVKPKCTIHFLKYELIFLVLHTCLHFPFT